MTKLSKETQEAVKGVVSKYGYKRTPVAVYDEGHRWVVEFEHGEPAGPCRGRMKETEEDNATLQRAADETAGRLPARETTTTTFADVAAGTRRRRRRTDGTERAINVKGPDFWPCYVRGAMEAMSNAASCCWYAAKTRDDNLALYAHCQRAEFNSKNWDSGPYPGRRARASEEWSRQVRSKVAALQPKVGVWCQGDWDED